MPAVSSALLENCTGCVLCSEDNGCVACHHRLFLLIWRDGIRQAGTCVHTCPPGYFGLRGMEVNRCTSRSLCQPGTPSGWGDTGTGLWMLLPGGVQGQVG